jgi:DNA-binding NtrC family response regulator
MGKILLVDREPAMRRILAANLCQDGHDIWEAGSAGEALARLSAQDCDAVLADERMTHADGLDLMTMVGREDPTVSIVVLTALAIEPAADRSEHGAFDFLKKPFEPQALRALARRACEHTRLLRENLLLKNTFMRLEGEWEIYGESRAMQEVRDTIKRVAPTPAAVLITGETGTGKELVARVIHHHSARAEKPFVAVNCAARSETLLETELFGHEKGAFPGADRSRKGLLEAAHGGTVFLDEGGELSPGCQTRLQRALADGELWRVGSAQARTVDARVLFATGRDLGQCVRNGLFRGDLFACLAAAAIRLPPLRERREDLPALSEALSRRIAADLKVPCRSVRLDALELLQAYPFPGNLRELRNLIERAYLVSSREEIEVEDLPRAWSGSSSATAADSGEPLGLRRSLPAALDLNALLARTEKDLIMRALSETGGTQAEAARRLGLSRSALAYKLNKYGIRGAA